MCPERPWDARSTTCVGIASLIKNDRSVNVVKRPGRDGPVGSNWNFCLMKPVGTLSNGRAGRGCGGVPRMNDREAFLSTHDIINNFRFHIRCPDRFSFFFFRQFKWAPLRALLPKFMFAVETCKTERLRIVLTLVNRSLMDLRFFFPFWWHLCTLYTHTHTHTHTHTCIFVGTPSMTWSTIQT